MNILQNDNFLEFIEHLEFPPDFKVLYPGGRFQPNFIVPPEAMIKVNDCIYQHNDYFWKMQTHERTLHCYIMTVNLAKL